VQTPNNVTSKAPSKGKDIWVEIRNKIRIDLDLGQKKSNQLWELLEQFLNVFAWHKGELGCCKFGKHVVTLKGFPHAKQLQANFHFGKKHK
jgi:hypothetical protein